MTLLRYDDALLCETPVAGMKPAFPRVMAIVLPSVPTRVSRLLSIATTAFSLSACELGWDCGTVRSTVANGTVRDAADVPLATVQVNLAEDVGPSMLRLSAGVMGPTGSEGAEQ